jgi:malonyl-CoA/methylmalonyl-CoA synthetase
LLDGVDLPVVDRLFATSALSALFAPPTVLAKLTRAWPQRHVPGVRCVFTGTQPLTQGLYRQARDLFGPVVRITYGKTECINPITVLTPEQTEDFFQTPSDEPGACVGWPAPGVELRIDPDTTEVWLRAPQMSLGFLDSNGLRPHEPDGWHATGDLGAWDRAGRLRLTGRVADVIKTGGYRVNPDEIEACLSSLSEAPGLCITSLPSDYWGEVIIAVCEREVDEWRTRVEQACEPLSRHKRPRLFVQLSSLPRNAQGKVSRRAVREAVLQAHDLIDGPYPRLEAKG